jgi:hypothetical protein
LPEPSRGVARGHAVDDKQARCCQGIVGEYDRRAVERTADRLMEFLARLRVWRYQ